MKIATISRFTAAALFGIAALVAQAAPVTGKVWINQPAAGANATIAQAATLGAADAEFTVGAIDFFANGSLTDPYTIAGFLKTHVFTNTSGSFNPDGTLDNTYFLFTGSLFLNAGANEFVVPHDDGLQLDIDGIAGFEVDAAGPTSPVDTPFNVNAPADGMYTFTLSYGEVFGAPATLRFIVNDQPVGGGDLPEPGALLLAGTALLGLVAARRRRG
jgi:hypothetical protein